MSGFITDHIKECVVCSGPVDTREETEGGDPDGCEVMPGEWVCCQDCWEDYVLARDFSDELQPTS